MKPRLVISLAALLIFSACMDATITQEIDHDTRDDMPEIAPQQEMEDLGTVYNIVHTTPVIIGGQGGLLSNIKYPTIARKANVEGRVYVKFVVDKNGDVRNAQVVRGIGAGCDEEALRVIRLAKFEPGRLEDGEAVNTELSMSIMFKLR